jgi:hypothetical protein
MPERAGSGRQLGRYVLAVVIVLGSGLTAWAAIDARLNPDEARGAAAFIYSMPEGEVSLTGFHCGIINTPSTAAFADPDDSDMPATVGLELFSDGGPPPLAASGHAGSDDGLGEVRNPLSARLNRIIVEDGAFSMMDGGAMEEVSLPEASMSVADLVDRCHP